MAVVICNHTEGLTYIKRVGGRHSRHLIGTVQSFNRSHESSAEVNNQRWRYVTSTWEEKGISVPSAEDNSAGNFAQSETGVTIPLEKSTNLVSVLYENSSIQPEKHQQQTLNNTGNDTQLLTENGSSLHQYSNGTARRYETQFQHHALNNMAIDTKNISYQDITRNLDTHNLLNIARWNVQEGNDLSSIRTTTSSLPSQSLENTVSVKLHDTVMLSSRSLHTSNHDVEVSDDSLRNSSNTNDANLTANLSVPQFFSNLTSTENSTTPFPDLNRNVAEDFKLVTQATDSTTHKVPSNSSEHFLKRHTTEFPERQPIMLLMPENSYTTTVPPDDSFLSSATPESQNQANIPENTSPSHSQLSAKSTTSAGYPSLFYLASANSNITTESSPGTTPVLNYSTESRHMLGTAVQSSNAGFADVPQTSPVPVPSVDYSILSLVATVPTSIPSISISPNKSLETWVTHTTPVASSVEAITSNTIPTTEPSPETINSSKISNTEQTTASVTSSTDNITLHPVTTFDKMSPIEGVSESTDSSTVPSVENISSRGISSTVQVVDTTNITSSSVQSPENVPLGLISDTVPSQATVNSNTIFSDLPSTETVMSSTISTFFSTVLSLSYQITTRDTIQDNKFQTDISRTNKSSDSIEEELRKSFTTMSDKSKTASLNDTCEVNILTPEKDKKIIHSDTHCY